MLRSRSTIRRRWSRMRLRRRWRDGIADLDAQIALPVPFDVHRSVAPSVLREHVADWFELDTDSPYMLLVAPVSPGEVAGDDDGGGAGRMKDEGGRMKKPGGLLLLPPFFILHPSAFIL
mgnify:CR=1 FL=1